MALFLIIPTIFVGLVGLFYGEADLDYLLLRSLRLIVVVIGTWFIVRSFLVIGSVEQLLVVAILAIFLNSIFSYLMFFNLSFREAILPYLYFNEDRVLSSNLNRTGGILTGGGASASVFAFFGVVITISLICQHKLSSFLGASLILFFTGASLLAGRTGMYLSFLFILLLPFIISHTCVYWCVNKGHFLILKGWATLFWLIIILILLFFSMNYFFTIELHDGVEWWFNRTFATIINFFNSGNFQDDTVDVLLTQFNIKNDIFVLLFGSGSDVGYQGRLFEADHGYLKYIQAFGFVGSLFAIFPYIYMLLTTRSANSLSRILFILVLVSLVVHAKEIFLYNRGSFNILMLVYSSYLYKKYIILKEKVNNG